MVSRGVQWRRILGLSRESDQTLGTSSLEEPSTYIPAHPQATANLGSTWHPVTEPQSIIEAETARSISLSPRRGKIIIFYLAISWALTLLGCTDGDRGAVTTGTTTECGVET
eukprot:1411543-Amphidinium_carterae.1